MMLDIIRQWLNGNKDYATGLAIYEQNNPDTKLLSVLQLGANPQRIKRLQEEIKKIYYQLTATPQNQPAPAAPANANISKTRTPVTHTGKNVTENSNKVAEKANKIAPKANKIAKDANADLTPVNKELYEACKLEADNEYKKVMNKRAVLFKKAAPDGYLDVNKPDLIFERGEMAVEIVQAWKKVSELYDRAQFVRINGRLPEAEEDDGEEYDHLPDIMVKQQLDNARKAYNKLKKKERTPERVALLQKHEENIEKLKRRWDSLQQKQ